MTLVSNSQYVGVDVETHKTSTYDGKVLIGVAVSVAVGVEVFTCYFTENYEELWAALEGKELICHNAAFDLRIIEENGCPTVDKFWDTMIMAHLVNENHMSYSLDSLAMIYLKERKQSMNDFEKFFGGWENIPTQIMADYACRDIYVTHRLWVRLRGELTRQGLDKLWPHAMAYVRTLQHIMSVGVPIDWTLAASMSAESRLEMEQIRKTIGFDPLKRKALESELFERAGLTVAFHSPSGKPVTDDSALRWYSLNHPEVQPLCQSVLRYRNLSKANSTWYEGFTKFRTARGTIHPGLKQHGTVTGRLSCGEPNLQQIPRDASRVKKLFLPMDGHVLVEFDFSQIELRLGSYYSKRMFGDPTMFDLYATGSDVHTNTSEMIGAFDAIENRSEARHVGKTGNFLWLYGGSSERLRAMLWEQYNIRASADQCKEWTAKFHKVYPGFRHASKHFDVQNRTKGYITMWNGRRRRLPQDKSHMAWNSMIQGGCGQILMVGLNKLDKLDVKTCMTVHDSVWVHVPVDQMDEQVALVQATLSEIPEKLFEMPFPIDYKVLAE